MVQLFLKKASPGAPAEWMLVELQGVIESPDSEQITGRFIGDLHFNNKGVPILIIGHHILYGKVSDLEKSFIVLTKNENVHGPEHGNTEPVVAMETNSTDEQNGDLNCDPEYGTADLNQHECDEDAYYVVKAVIRRKMVFKTRPKPIITNVPKKL
ncbi:chromosome transmission fidelity protein 8 homolog [Diadema setosum]|uniref:chromosome transmission fidelity protein 8 homolog n=1 Tax=Diadema setosum TaxID=31175 RepID=UPI003B3B0A0A